MKAIIQHNFRSGLGDMVCDMSEYMAVTQYLKEKGYEVHLRFCYYRNLFINNSPFFQKIFTEEIYNLFDSITETSEPISELSYENIKYNYSSQHPQSPGLQRWDIFIDNFPKDFKDFKFNSNSIVFNSIYPPILPSFHSNIIERVNSFQQTLPEKYNFFHIRLNPEYSDKEMFSNIIDYVNKSEIPTHIGTNNMFLYNECKKNDKILLYPFKYLDLIDNELDSIHYFKDNENYDFMLNRLYDNLAEMISVKNCNEILYHTNFSWVSNFIYYGLCFNKKSNKIF
jgi:hypothetical protein